jgi:aminoglycoside phosphotransferase (APT) family kinase protein
MYNAPESELCASQIQEVGQKTRPKGATAMNATIQNIVAQVPAWRQARSITIEPQKGGLTNANYLLTVDGERFVLRISGDRAAQLGINRQSEYEALMAVSAAGIAPQVLLFTLPEGHLITHFVKGREWTMEEFKAPEVIRCVAETMRRVHALPAIEGAFSPYRDIERRLDAARSRQAVLPESLNRFLDKLYAIEQERAEKASPSLRLTPLSRPRNDQNKRDSYVVTGQQKPAECTSAGV